MDLSLNDIKLETYTEGVIDFKKYIGRPLLIFNSASECAFTKQYADFQKIYEVSDVVPIAIPTNEFGNQEPGDDEKILKFCSTNFNTKFPICKKTGINHEFFLKFGKPEWNFSKYLFDRDHNFVKVFGPKHDPMTVLDEDCVTNLQKEQYAKIQRDQ